MWEWVVEDNLYTLDCTPDQNKMQELCDKAVGKSPGSWEYVPHECKTQEMWK